MTIYRCELCDREYADEVMAARHVKKKHLDESASAFVRPAEQ